MVFVANVVASALDPIIIATVIFVMALAKELNTAMRAIIAMIASVGLHTALLPRSDIAAAIVASLIWVLLFWGGTQLYRYLTT